MEEVPLGALTVAAGQGPCAALDVPANVATAAGLVRRAAGAGADVLVLPELFLTGYELPAIVANPAAYTLDGGDARLDPLAAACADTGTTVVAGAPTRDAGADRVRISALVLGSDGRLTARYDKQHPTAKERAAGVSPGSGGCTLTVAGWRLGLGICSDSDRPEHVRAAVHDGCHAYLVGAMFDRHDGGEHRRSTIFPARAQDNAVYVVLANHNGPSGPYHGCGRSAVWDPTGALIAEAEAAGPGLATARLDPGVLGRARRGVG